MNSIRKTLMVVALIASSNALAAGAAGDTDQYQAERARCMSGTTGQDQASCLRSADAAREASRQGRLTNPNTDYSSNAMDRCKALPPADRADCESRVNGGGTTSGSVKSGGIVTETVTKIPASKP